MRPESPGPARTPVAIVGIGCRFAGNVVAPQDYWRLLVEGRDAIGPIPKGRFDPALLARPDGVSIPPFGGFVDHIDELDAAFFGISPREAERLDPQQRLLLETAWEALEDAGLDVAQLAGAQGGIFVGQWLSDFEDRLLADPAHFDFLMTTGSGRYATSGRMSALLGWQGPSLTVDSACSSSLAAVHLAARSIQNGDSEIAIAAGVNVILAPHISLAYSSSGMLAPDGRCKFGDASADGYVRSEGAAVVVLKSLDRALRDGNRIYATIVGSAVNNDGGTSGSLGTPSRAGQEALLRSALADAGLEPHQVGYIEAHGTGTRAGDPVEIAAIGAVLGRGRAADNRLLVGSAKTNLGHTEGAAGLAGLIKAVLCVHEGVIPPSLHCKVPSPSIAWDELGCRVVTSAALWPSDRPRIAGASSFGIGGTNAHVLVCEPPSRATRSNAGAVMARSCILPLSARSPEALRALAGRYAQLLSQDGAPNLLDVCRNAALRRTGMEYRAAFIADDATTMAEGLVRYSDGEAADTEGSARDGNIAFVAPGQGAQWLGMAQGLLANEPAFRDTLLACEAAARRYIDWSIVDLVARPDRPDVAAQLERIDVIQPTLVALSIAYAALLASVGVKPAALTGHSMGEVAAAHLAGIIDLGTAMQIICRRSALMSCSSGKGAMALVELPLPEARRRIARDQDVLAVAAHNGPNSCVLSGDPVALARVLAELEADDVFCRLVKVDVASHSPQMAPAAAGLQAALTGIEPREALIPFYSTSLGRRASGDELGAAYWGQNLTSPVLFADAVDAIACEGISTFVELGPHPVLLPSIQQTIPDATLGVCGRRNEPDAHAFAVLLATLWTRGTELDWTTVLPGPDTFVRLPTYPWQRERHWFQGADIGRRTAEGSRLEPIDDEQRSWLYRLEWQALDLPPSDPTLHQGPWLILGSGATAGWIKTAIEKGGGSALKVALEDLSATLSAVADKARLIVAPSAAPDPYLAIDLLRHMPETAGAVRTWIVTDGAQSIAGEPADAAGAALWGAARVAREERPDLNLVLVDVDRGEPSTVDLLVANLLGRQTEEQLAIRDGRCFGLRMKSGLAETPAPMRWRSDATYLISGGFGEIGLILADVMVKQGARRLVLMGRTPLPQRSAWMSSDHPPRVRRRIDAIRALEAQGASVHLAFVDVADEVAVTRYLAEYAAEGWPSIKGVVHAAGTFANRLAGDMDRAAFQAVLEPKLGGAMILDRLLPELDLFVLFSSIGGYLPQPGQANYAAANAGLEAIAQQRRLRGQPATCLAWGVWDGAGLVADASGRANVAEMERHGSLAMSPPRAAALFAHLCTIGSGTALVCRMDWQTFVRARSGRNTALFEDVLQNYELPAALSRDLESLEPKERRARTEQIVRAAVGQVLKIAPGKLAADRTLGSMGMSSLIAMELRNRLASALNRPLSATLVWNHPTISALAEHLSAGKIVVAAPVRDTAQGDAGLQAELAAVNSLSEEDAIRELVSSRSRGGRR